VYQNAGMKRNAPSAVAVFATFVILVLKCIDVNLTLFFVILIFISWQNSLFLLLFYYRQNGRNTKAQQALRNPPQELRKGIPYPVPAVSPGVSV
jgi:hypothetical protein